MEQRDKLSNEKREIVNAIELATHDLGTISHDLWRFAEPPSKEYKSCDRVIMFLKRRGFKIRDEFRDVKGLETSFRMDCVDSDGNSGGDTHPNIGLMCEYSADPVSGHAKGHNLMTSVCLAAAIGLQRVVKMSRIPIGTVTVIGCGGDEENRNKVRMLMAGYFKGIDCLLAAYPTGFTCLLPSFVTSKS